MNTDQELISHLSSAARLSRLGDFRDAASAANNALPFLDSWLSSSSPEIKTKLTYALETMLLMQQQQDWVGYADVIEYELIPLIKKNGQDAAKGPLSAYSK
jgi:hypothetical protein